MQNPYVRYKKLHRPPLKPATTTLWEYPHQQYGDGKQGDARYKGATPSWVVWQVLHRWTQPGDVVLDPFCGSGTTLDVCKDLGRQGRGFDLAPVRDDVERADARALPLDDQSVDHAFLDPPYADNLAYSDDPACIGKLPAEGGQWHEAMAAVFDEMARVVRPGGVIAVYVQDTVRKDGEGRFVFHDLGLDAAVLGRERFSLIEHAAVVRGNARLDDAREHKKASAGALIRGFNHLLVFEVPGREAPRLRPSAAPGKRRGQGPRKQRGRGKRRDR